MSRLDEFILTAGPLAMMYMAADVVHRIYTWYQRKKAIKQIKNMLKHGKTVMMSIEMPPHKKYDPLDYCINEKRL